MTDDAALTAESGHDVAALADFRRRRRIPIAAIPLWRPLRVQHQGRPEVMAALPALCVLTGSAIVAYALQTAIRTFLLPQPGLSLLSRMVFRAVRPVFEAIERMPIPGPRRQTWMNIYAPLCLLLIVFTAMVIISLGFTLTLYGLGLSTLQGAFLASISSVSTLGFATLPGGMAIPVVATLETMTGILLVALLIGYLPTIFAAVQQREQGIAALAAHVGLPSRGRPS